MHCFAITNDALDWALPLIAGIYAGGVVLSLVALLVSQRIKKHGPKAWRMHGYIVGTVGTVVSVLLLAMGVHVLLEPRPVRSSWSDSPMASPSQQATQDDGADIKEDATPEPEG